MRIGLSMYGTTYAMGLHPRSGKRPMNAENVIAWSLGANLQGVELPEVILAASDLSAIAELTREKGFYVAVASGGYDPAKLGEACRLAAASGARIVRTVAGGARIGGDRRHLAGSWGAFMEEVREGLTAAVRIAEQEGVTIALENHQDLASEELVWLCESIASPNFGLTLDTGNPLATAEEPVEFARRIAPHIKNVHLKDYWIYPSEEGYRLVRCPLGQGVVDFPALMSLFRRSGLQDLPMSIEIGALEARHIRVLADDYWPAYPERSARQLAELMRFVHANSKPAADWRTPHEREAAPDDVNAYERSQLRSSIAYMQSLLEEVDSNESGEAFL
ncbi:sugar phosphate isomerase/epimerase family protein [Paenibacillus sacheonensis]|uniref:TIM barrel protein n=1 Tax=Paenibacillus sacheonensis TaxID=742054 RepID=A0A7X4YQ37_9BACL|nr:sugar phosphate isomerase/epimerase family protein [Paenibacillus sacheonensis]MBM7565562.1 sugar phosphate isomerase/epimerase [Paenibacillus sacheonensis]NBC69519.1 TIM barrel protein [Paenibacillus sacheonensis]